jgi:hypothetical protein
LLVSFGLIGRIGLANGGVEAVSVAIYVIWVVIGQAVMVPAAGCWYGLSRSGWPPCPRLLAGQDCM